MRGQPVFMLSILLQCLEPILRQTAGVAPWQVGWLLADTAALEMLHHATAAHYICKAAALLIVRPVETPHPHRSGR